MSTASLETIEAYRNRMRIEKHRLDDELEIQAELLHRIFEKVVSASSAAMEAKDVLERIEGDVYFEAKHVNPKATVPELQGITRTDPARIKAWRMYRDAKAEQESWEGLHEAWKSRGFALRSLVDLRLANYYTSDSDAGENRRALNDVRRGLTEPPTHRSRRVHSTG